MVLFARPGLNSELVNFATEYGQVQKRLLKELELPHALLDGNGRIMWMNSAFEALGERDRFYKKNIHNKKYLLFLRHCIHNNLCKLFNHLFQHR